MTYGRYEIGDKIRVKTFEQMKSSPNLYIDESGEFMCSVTFDGFRIPIEELTYAFGQTLTVESIDPYYIGDEMHKRYDLKEYKLRFLTDDYLIILDNEDDIEREVEQLDFFTIRKNMQHYIDKIMKRKQENPDTCLFDIVMELDEEDMEFDLTQLTKHISRNESLRNFFQDDLVRHNMHKGTGVKIEKKEDGLKDLF